jgi:U3 small nucleolar RNA-associated protein 20
MRWRESLSGLLVNEEKMREQLVELTAASSREHPIEPTVLPVLVKILYGRMVARRGTGAGRSNPQVRRKLILNYVASWSPQCIAAFVAEALPSEGAEERKVLGFLNLAEALIGKVVRFLPGEAFHGLVGAIYGYACLESSKEGKRIAMSRILQVYALAFGTQGEDRWMEEALGKHSNVLWRQIIGPKLPDLPQHYSQSSSTLLDFFALLAQHDPMALVHGDSRLVGQLVACLAQSKVKPEVIDKLVGVFEGLLGSEAAVSEAILPNLTGLLSAIARRLEGLLTLPKASRVLGRLVAMLVGLAGLLLGSGASSKVEAINVLCALLLDAIPTRVIGEPLKASMLQILAHLIPAATELDTGRLMGLLGSWFSGVTGLQGKASRTALSTAFKALCARGQTARLGELIGEMNSYAEEVVLDEEPDYVRRAAAYARVKEMAVPDAWWPAILHSALFALQSVDLSLRHQSTFLLEAFLKGPSNLALVQSLVWPGLRPGLRSKDEGVRTSFLEVLARTVGAFPGETPMASLVPLLAHGDEEANVLLNLGHVQVHRRVRATRRLGEWASEAAALPKALLEDILIPLLKPSAIPADSATEVNPLLQAESIQTLAILTAKLPPKALCARLSMQLKRLMALTAAEAAAASLDIGPAAGKGGVRTAKASPMVKALLKLIPAVVARIEVVAAAEGASVISGLLPLLFRAMNPAAVDAAAIQLPIAEAIGGLLARSGDEAVRGHSLPRLFTALAQTQHSRDFGRREAGRQALGALLGRVGPAYLEAVLRELDVALLAGGRSVGTTAYRHIHGHALASLLPACPVTDACFDRFVASAVAQAFGALAREKGRKGSEWTGRMVEVRTQRAFDMLKGLLAIASESQLRLNLLGRLKTVLSGLDGGSQDDRVAVDGLFKALQEGLQAHPLPSVRAHMVLLHDLIAPEGGMDSIGGTGDVYGHRFQVLGIRLLHGHLKQHGGEAEIIGFLDGFVAPLVESHLLRSKHAALQTAAIKCLALLISRPAWIPSMPALDPLVPRILLRAFELLIRQQQQQQQQQQATLSDSAASSTSAELTSSCLRLIAAMVRSLPAATLTQSQLRALLLFTRTNLEASTTGKASLAFALLRALLSRRIVMLEVAEVMADILRALLASTSQACRAECRAVYLQFLLEYPLGEARLAELLGTMMKNLGFDWDTGRHSLLSLWTQLIPRLPQALLEHQADVLLISLAARVAQEASAKVLPALHACLDALACRLVSLPAALASASLLITRWIGAGPNEGVVQAAWIVAGHYVKAIVGLGKAVDCDLVDRVVARGEAVLASCQSAPLLLAVLGTLSHLQGRIPGTLRAVLLTDALLLFPNAQVRDRLQQILRAAVIPEADAQTLSAVSKATVKHLLDLPAAAEPPVIDGLAQSLLAVALRLPLSGETGSTRLALVRKLEKLVKQRLAEGTWQIGLPLLTGTLRFLAALLVRLDGDIECSEAGDGLATAVLSIAHRIAVAEEITVAEPKDVATHLQEMLKAKLGADRFARLHAALLTGLSKTRAARKAQLAQMALNDPLAYARRTMKRNEAKKEQRKRKIDRVREAACKRKRTRDA